MYRKNTRLRLCILNKISLACMKVACFHVRPGKDKITDFYLCTATLARPL
jgi:hypothetical protein